MSTTYNLFDIIKNIIKSKNPREYIKKVKNRKFIYGYYLIDKNELIKMLNKSKSPNSNILLTKINNNQETGYELEEKSLLDKYNRINNYINIGEQLINYEKKLIKYVYDDKGTIYFRGKDICKILEYADSINALKRHINEQDKFRLENINSLDHATPLGNEDGKTIYINETGLYKLIIK